MRKDRLSIVSDDAFRACLEAFLAAHKRWVLAADPRNDDRARTAEMLCADGVCAASDAFVAAIDAYVFAQLAEQAEEAREDAANARLRTALGLNE